MPSNICLGAAIAAILIVSAAMTPSANAAPADDACSLLTQAQLSAALGTAVGAGQYQTPTDKNVCTWSVTTPAATGPKFVTLLLQSLNAYQGGKTMGGVRGVTVTSVSGVGDDAYYLIAGTNVGLIVKKGNAAFKLAVYATSSVEQKEAMEKTLAAQAVSKL